MEKLREHLGIERWLLWGVSWGSTLLLAYAERYPERVSEIVITGVSTTRRSEIDWLYRGLYRFFPEEWVRFRAGAGDPPDDGLIVAYSRLMADPDAHVRAQAAQDGRRGRTRRSRSILMATRVPTAIVRRNCFWPVLGSAPTTSLMPLGFRKGNF
jgi:pimeloyl-ACP methyl ester carboxylesterase